MDIEQLRGWATFMDRAVIVSLVATVLSVSALATTTWLSFKAGGAVRAHEQAAFDRYKAEMGKHAVELEQKVSTAQERAAALEQKVTTAQDRTTKLEQAASEADARAAQAARESVTSREQARSAEIDAEEVRKRVAELAKLVKDAGARAPASEPPPAPSSAPAAETPQPREEAAPAAAAASPEPQPAPPSPIVESLRKYAGTKAAVYVVGEVQDAAPVGATIAGYLGDAGWSSATWTWSGVSGIFGVVVLVKDGSDAATNEAAAAIVEAVRTAGFNAVKGDWPAGASWSRFRGVLNGPQTPGPTEASIRIVIGARTR